MGTLAPVPVVTAAAPSPSPSIAPTLTSEPLAARVNGQPIRRAEVDLEVLRCRAGRESAGADPATCPTDVLSMLVEQLAIEQAAAAAGLSVPAESLAAQQDQIISDLGGTSAYQAWLQANQYTDQAFQLALQRESLRARLAEQVMSVVSDRAEQVHARSLVVADEAAARALLEQVKSGADFASLALAYSLDLSSRPAGGDLGWFPRGLLTVPEVEQAAFSLQPGETSDVIQSPLGYHLVQVLERDPQRPLSALAAQTLRQRAYQAWLDDLLARAAIEILMSP